MVREDKLHHSATGVEHAWGVSMNHHTLGAVGLAGRSEVTTAVNLDNAYTASAWFVIIMEVVHVHVAEGRNLDTY